LIFDFVIIFVSVLDAYVLVNMTTFNTEEETSIISAFRFLRVARVLRSIKLFRYFKELYLLINGFFKAFRTLFWIVFLIILTVYVCSIFFTRQIGHNREMYILKGQPEKYGECDVLGQDYDPHDHWGYVPYSMYTLFQIVTLEGWADIAEPLIQTDRLFIILFVLFILFTHFTILNLFVAVIVEHVQSSSSTADLSLMREVTSRRQTVFVKLTELFERADADNSGTLTCEELKAICDEPDVIETLRSLEVNSSEIDWLFDVLDTDGNRILSIDEFVSGMLNVKSSEQSRQLFQVQHTLLKEVRHLRRVKHEILGLDESPGSLTQQASAKATPRDNSQEPGNLEGALPSSPSLGVPSDGDSGALKSTDLKAQLKVAVPLSGHLGNTALEKKIGTVAKDLHQLGSAFTNIQTALRDAENSASVHGWDERSSRKAKLILDKLNEQSEAFEAGRNAISDAVLRARGQNVPNQPRASPRQSPRALEGVQAPAGSPPVM
jgi:hypothetical protein